jgi:rare lipoprotein A
MSKKFWTGMTTAALATFLGTTAFSFGSSNRAVASQPADSLPAVEQQSEATDKPNIKPLAPSDVKGRSKRESRGVASWYGPGFHGRRTANGERFNQNGLTAAHRSLPFGTKVKVTNVNNGRSVVVRINDLGPYAKGRVIDLSAGAARVIGLINSGVAPVRIQVLGR